MSLWVEFRSDGAPLQAAKVVDGRCTFDDGSVLTREELRRLASTEDPYVPAWRRVWTLRIIEGE